MKIPATCDGETVYIVGFDTRNPYTAIVIRSSGAFGSTLLSNLTVLSGYEDQFSGPSFVPLALDADKTS